MKVINNFIRGLNHKWMNLNMVEAIFVVEELDGTFSLKCETQNSYLTVARDLKSRQEAENAIMEILSQNEK